MILTNPEGRKESDETIIQTDEDGAKQKALHKFINYAFISHFFKMKTLVHTFHEIFQKQFRM